MRIKIKKAQTEIMGLAIIAVMIIVGILFAAGHISNKEEVNYKKEFMDTYLANNIIDVFLKTASRDCGSLSMSELLQDCSDNIAGLRITCGTLDSCAYFEEEAKEIFGKTLEEWKVNYEFKALDDEDKEVISLGKGCSKNKKSGFFYIPAENGVLAVILSIC